MKVEQIKTSDTQYTVCSGTKQELFTDQAVESIKQEVFRGPGDSPWSFTFAYAGSWKKKIGFGSRDHFIWLMDLDQEISGDEIIELTRFVSSKIPKTTMEYYPGFGYVIFYRPEKMESKS